MWSPFQYFTWLFMSQRMYRAQSSDWNTILTMYPIVQSQKPTTIFNQNDVSSVVSISPTVLGDLIIATSVAQSIALDGIVLIKGNLICDNASNLTNLSSNSISRIEASMTLRNLTELSTLSFPRLEAIGLIDWYALFSLDEPSFEIGVDTVHSITIGNSFLSSLGYVSMGYATLLKIYKNPRLREISMKLFTVKNMSIYDKDNLITIWLGNPRYAENIYLKGNFTDISGFSSMSTIANLSMVTDSPFNCTEAFSRYTEGNFVCISANSTFRVRHPNQPTPNISGVASSTTARSTRNYSTGTSLPTSPTEFTKEGTKSKGLSIIAITFIVLVPLTLSFAIITYFCYRNYRKRAERRRNASWNPVMPELPTGGHHENIELEVVEKPSELADFKYPEMIPIELPASPFARIIDVSEVDEHQNTDGRGELEHLVTKDGAGALNTADTKVKKQTLERT